MGSGNSDIGRSKGGVNPANIHEMQDLFSQKDNKPYEVAGVAKVAQDIQQKYGVVSVSNMYVADFGGKDSGTLGCSDGQNVIMNNAYMNHSMMNNAMQKCYENGFHPALGNKSGIEAVAAHEFGHVLTAQVGEKIGVNNMHAAAVQIVREARRNGFKQAGPISGYAKTNHEETVAEAFCDVYCNGKKANSNSQAIVSVIDGYLAKK